jgi:deoxyribose-phosphate aldolase
MTAAQVAAHIQQTDLRPEATRADIERLLAECVEHGFQATVVSPIWLPLALRTLRGTPVVVCTALDFPAGGDTTATVVRATREARQAGVEEVEVMTKVGWLKSEMDVAYRQHLAAVVKAAEGATVKATLEASLLTRHEMALAVELCADAGVDYVVDGGGMRRGSATPDLIAELVRLTRGRVKVKAFCGARSTQEAAEALLGAGAELLGSTSGVAILSNAAA